MVREPAMLRSALIALSLAPSTPCHQQEEVCKHVVGSQIHLRIDGSISPIMPKSFGAQKASFSVSSNTLKICQAQGVTCEVPGVPS